MIISVDYEIFGNGAGDVRKHIIAPSERLMEVCGREDVPITFMVDTGEYAFFRDNSDRLEAQLGYDPAALIRRQMTAAYSCGHDVQLHIHPQWADCKLRGGDVHMPDPRRSVADMSGPAVADLIEVGKEALAHCVSKPGYRCSALRWTNLPWTEAPKNTWKPMGDAGITVHSLSDSSSPKNKKGYWRLGDSGVFEVPIHSVGVPRWKAYTFRRARALMYQRMASRRGSPSGPKGTGSDGAAKGGGKVVKTEGDLEHGASSKGPTPFQEKWDLCKMGGRRMLWMLDEGIRRFESAEGDVPLVMIGHTKDMLGSGPLETLIRNVKAREDYGSKVKFSTLEETARILA